MATPPRIQCHSGLLLGMWMDIKKLVEWPVVARTPLLSAHEDTKQCTV